MTNSPETPRRKPKMAQGKQAYERPPDDLQDQFKKHPRKTKKLQEQKVNEIIERERDED